MFKRLISKHRAFRVWVKRYFWLWVIYQAVKGSLTLSFIWIPLLYAFLNK